MKIAVFSTKSYDQKHLEEANQAFGFDLTFFKEHLQKHTAILARGFDVVSAFVKDTLDKETLSNLKNEGIEIIALRCAGFNNVNRQEALRLGFHIVNSNEITSKECKRP